MVAGVLVYMEREGDRPAQSSLEALGEGRRIASSLGAPLHAFIPTADAPSPELIAAVGDGGADQALTMQSPELSAQTAWMPHGLAMYAACERTRPLLVLIPATAGGRDIGPRLAARLGAAFVAEPSIECGPRGEIVLTRTLYRAEYLRRLAAEDIGRTVVATLTPGSYAPAQGSADDCEVLAIEPPSFSPASPYELDEQEDPDRALDTARIVVTAGAGVRDAEQLALVERLAQALGGELGATGNLCRLGLVSPSREIGIGARHVAPRLYIVCGASGSAAHLGAVGQDAEIVAINSDPDAPIFRVASYGIVGDLAEVLPAWIEELA